MFKIPYGKQEVLKEDIEAVRNALVSDFLTQGPLVEKFELDFSRFVGSELALSTNSATAALHLAMKALGVQPGQRILCPTISFVASANCVRYMGADVEFVDIDPTSYCIDPRAVAAKLSKASKGYYSGVIVVHLAGYPVNVEEIAKIVRPHGLWIVEDACHAPGAKFLSAHNKWSLVGSCEFSDAAVFSFHPVKHIGTGEGGMLTTNRRDLFELCKRLRSHGIERQPEKLSENHGGWFYEMKELGFNYRMPDVLCALGISQLKRIEENINKRTRIAKVYQEHLSRELEQPHLPPNVKHAFHLYVVKTSQRKQLYDHLKTKGIFSQVHYIPIHTQPYYKDLYGTVSLPHAENYYLEAISLPMFHGLQEQELEYVIKTVNGFFGD